MPPTGFVGSIPLTVTATTQESSNHHQTSQSIDMPVRVDDFTTGTEGLDPQLKSATDLFLHGTENNDVLSSFVLKSTIQGADIDDKGKDYFQFEFLEGKSGLYVETIRIDLFNNCKFDFGGGLGWSLSTSGYLHPENAIATREGITGKIVFSQIGGEDHQSSMLISFAENGFGSGGKLHFGTDVDGQFGSWNISANDLIGTTITYTLSDGTTQVVTLTGSNNVISATYGKAHHYIDGHEGDDTIYDTSSRDNLVGGEGNDTIYAEGGDDYILGGSGNDQLFGGAGNDTLLGGAGDDFLSGGVGNDILNGSVGNDRLLGGAGDDLLSTGLGQDTIIFNVLNAADAKAGNGTDTWTDYEASDKIEFDANFFAGLLQDKSNIGNYIKVEDDAQGNAVLKVDRDGTGTSQQWADLLIIEGKSQTELQDLIHQQIIIG